HGRDTAGWTELANGRPVGVYFWYRTSPSLMLPFNQIGSVSMNDPPNVVNGMVRMAVDTNARLLQFEAAPPQLESTPAAAPAPADWSKMFAAAGLDPSAFTPAEPSRTPGIFADDRRTWKGTLPGTDIPVTIDAASYRGRPVMFQIVNPWTPASREPQNGGSSGTTWIFISLLLIGAAVASYVNLRRGRADRRGAFRLASFMVVILVTTWIVNRHVDSGPDELQRFFAWTGLALFVGFAMYILYVGLEPLVRRLWPSMLVAWARVLSGGLRDPLIGRDALIGVAAGAAMALVQLVPFLTAPLIGRPAPAPFQTDLTPLLGVRGTIGTLMQAVNNGLQNTLVNVFVYASYRMIFETVTRAPIGRSRWTIASKLRMSASGSDYVFAACFVAVTAAIAGGGNGVLRALTATQAGVFSLLMVFVLLRLGIFAAAVMFVTASLLQRVPMTFDAAALYSAGSWIALGPVPGPIAYRFPLAPR